MSNTEFAFWGTVIIGSLGLVFALWAIWSDCRDEPDVEDLPLTHHDPRQRRLFYATAIAIVLASVVMRADALDAACQEATLRVVCGDCCWYACYLALGCYMLPGGG